MLETAKNLHDRKTNQNNFWKAQEQNIATVKKKTDDFFFKFLRLLTEIKNLLQHIHYVFWKLKLSEKEKRLFNFHFFSQFFLKMKNIMGAPFHLASHAGALRGARSSSLPTNAVCEEGWKTSSPKNACVGGYSPPINFFNWNWKIANNKISQWFSNFWYLFY